MKNWMKLLLVCGMILGVVGCGTTGGSGTPEMRLSDAIWKRDAGTVEQLLKAGVNPNSRARSGSPMMAWAYEMQNPQAVQLLLKHGVKPEANNSDGMLFHAVGTNDFELVKLLVSRGANVNAGDFPAISYVESKEMLEYLLSQGANIRQLNIYGQPPGFNWAHKNPALWREFVAHGADAVPRDSKGQTNTQYWQAAKQEQYQKTLEHNAQIERDNERNRQANENMARQAQSVTREVELRESIARASQSGNNSSTSNTPESTLDRMNKAYSAQQDRDATSAGKEQEHRCSASNMSSDSRSGC